MVRVAIYERVSTQEQAMHGLSLDAQDMKLRAWCDDEGHTIVDTYRDEGVSGRKPVRKRPELLRLLTDIEQDKIELVLFTKLDRWTRNVAQYYIAQKILDEHSVAWKALDEDYETLTAAGRFKVNIMLAVAENEADRTSERIRAVNEYKRAKGQMASGRVPWGYVKRDNVISIDEGKHEAMLAVIQTYFETTSIQAARDAAAACGQPITYRVIDAFLRSPIIKGEYGAPAIVTEAEYAQLQAMRVRTTRKVKEDRTYLFTGMIYCSECGGRMHSKFSGSTYKGKSYSKSPSYFCGNRRERKCGNSVNISENDVVRALLDNIDLKIYDIRIEAKAQKKSNVDKKIAAIKVKQSRLKDLYVNSLISLEEYKSDVDKYAAQIAELELQYRPIDSRVIDELSKGDWRTAYEQADRKTQRGFWQRCISRIEVNSKREIDFSLIH